MHITSFLKESENGLLEDSVSLIPPFPTGQMAQSVVIGKRKNPKFSFRGFLRARYTVLWTMAFVFQYQFQSKPSSFGSACKALQRLTPNSSSL